MLLALTRISSIHEMLQLNSKISVIYCAVIHCAENNLKRRLNFAINYLVEKLSHRACLFLFISNILTISRLF